MIDEETGIVNRSLRAFLGGFWPDGQPPGPVTEGTRLASRPLSPFGKRQTEEQRERMCGLLPGTVCAEHNAVGAVAPGHAHDLVVGRVGMRRGQAADGPPDDRGSLARLGGDRQVRRADESGFGELSLQSVEGAVEGGRVSEALGKVRHRLLRQVIGAEADVKFEDGSGRLHNELNRAGLLAAVFTPGQTRRRRRRGASRVRRQVLRPRAGRRATACGPRG